MVRRDGLILDSTENYDPREVCFLGISIDLAPTRIDSGDWKQISS